MSDSETIGEVSQIDFNYIKGNHFRVIHADGVMSNGTPRGGLFLGFYSERFPLPDSQTFEINKEGRATSEIIEKRKINSNGIMREVEVGITLDIEVAKILVLSLSQMIRQVEANVTETEEDEAENTFGHFQAWLESKNLYGKFISSETTNEKMFEIIEQYDRET